MEDKLDKPFHELINEESITDLSVETADLLLNSILEGELIDDIPFVGLVTKTIKVGKSVKEYFFIKKIVSFLFELQDYSMQERKDFTNRIQNSDSSKEKFGETIIIIIDRLDSVEKAQIVGRLTSNLINQKLSREECLRFCRIVERSFLEDLKALNLIHKKKMVFSDLDYSALQSLESYGLIWSKKLDHASWQSLEDELDDREYNVTLFGKKLVEFGLS